MLEGLQVFYGRLADPGMYEQAQEQGAAIAQRQQTLQNVNNRLALNSVGMGGLFTSHNRGRAGPANIVHDMVSEAPVHNPYEWYLQGWLRCCTRSAEQRIRLHRVWGNRVIAVLHLLHQHAAASAKPETSGGGCCTIM